MYTLLLTCLLLRHTVATSTDDDIAARTLRWANLTNVDSTYDYSLNLTIHDLHHSLPAKGFNFVPVDTGSVGFLVSACTLGYDNDAQISSYKPAFEFLSSSGVYYDGRWIPKKIAFTSKDDKTLQSTTPVFVVTETGICPSASGCNSTTKTNVSITTCDNQTYPFKHIRYLGVGFARWSTEQPNATAEHNVLLQTDLSAFGRIDKGYTIGSDGLILGVRDTDFDGFSTLKLTQNTSVTYDVEWNPVHSCVQIADGECHNGEALFDTGIDYSFIGVDERVQHGHNATCPSGHKRCLKAGTDVSVSIGSKGKYIANYSFKANESTGVPQVSPAENRLEGPKWFGSYINTGRFFFNGFRMIFNHDKGIVGLKWMGGDALKPIKGHGMDQQPMLKTDL